MPLLHRNDFSMYKSVKGQSKRKHIHPHVKNNTVLKLKKNSKPSKIKQIQQSSEMLQETEENVKPTNDEKKNNQNDKVQTETVVEHLEKKVRLKL